MKNFLKSSTTSSKKNSWGSIFDTGQSPTGKAADAGYTTAKKQASQQANLQTVQNFASNLTQNVFQPDTFGVGKQTTGKAADSGYTAAKTTPSLSLGMTTQTTGLAADSGYTQTKKQASQAANRQTVQNWWNNEQTKSAQDNSTARAYTAKLTGGANIDNSTEVMKSLQRTFGGANDSAKTQYDRTLKSKMGYGRNWGNPRSAVGNAIESGVAGTVADWLNAAGTALKSDRRSGLAVDSGDIEAKATGKEWYNRAGNYLQKEADWARMLSENAYLRGSRNLNNAQKLLFDAGIAGTQMASDVALGTLTGGSAMIPMAIRSFGSGAQRARQAGATENQQIAYGTANAIKEALTEKMFDGFGRIYGKGTADDFVDSLARSFAKSDGGQALARGLLNMGGEGLEELASGFVDPALQSIYNGKTLGENYRELSMDDLLHEGAVGVLLGGLGLGGSVNMAQTTNGNPLSYTDALNKMNLSTPDNRAMNRTGDIAIGGKTDYTENNKTEAQNYAKVYLRDSGERFGGAYSGRQVSAVEESAGRAAHGQATLRPADSEAASLTFGKAVSTALLGIDGGSKQETIHLLSGDETLCTARAKRIASERGLQLVLFAGDNLHIAQANGSMASVRGYISGNRVFVRADHPRYTSEQIMLHEAGHDMIAMGEIDLNEVRDYIAENRNVGKTAQLYMDAYAGTDMTADEIWEELICDSLGDMNIFSETLGEEMVQEYLTETRRAVEAVQRESVGSRAPPVDGKMSIELDDLMDNIRKAPGIKWNGGRPIELSKSEYAAVTSRISTRYHYTNTQHDGVQFVDRTTDGPNAQHFVYLYVDHGFGTYQIVGRLTYGRNDELIRFLREVITHDRTAERISESTGRLRNFYKHSDSGGVADYD